MSRGDVLVSAPWTEDDLADPKIVVVEFDKASLAYCGVSVEFGSGS